MFDYKLFKMLLYFWFEKKRELLDDDDTINDEEFSLAIKGDTTNNNNEINNMITDIYMENSNNKKKSNLKAVSMFDPNPTTTATTESYLNGEKKNVSFSTAGDTNNRKRKLPNGTPNEQQHQQVNKQQNSLSSKKSSAASGTSALNNDLIRSPINFESFACDQELKENIFRRIYYILSPEHFQENGKIPPRGFLLHGPPGCGKTQLVYAIAGVWNFSINFSIFLIFWKIVCDLFKH